jgi:hypothetical protein
MKLLQRTCARLEDQLTTSTREEPALKQSRRWIRAVTWSLIGATGFSIA